MTIDPTIGRRAVLAVGAAGGLVLAACSAGRRGAADRPSRQPANRALVRLEDIPVGQAKSVDLPDGSPAIVARPTATTAACFSAICTHAGCTVQPQGAKLDCPCHGSQFAATTGAVLHGPAAAPLRRIQVRVADGRVVTT